MQQMLMQNQQLTYLAQSTQPQGMWYSGYFQNVQQQQLMQFGMWFQAIDKDRSGSLSAMELMSIQFNGRNISLGVANCLVKMVDQDQSDSVSFWEYVALHMFIMQVQQAFVNADFDRSGRISLNEISTALAGLGFQLEPLLVRQLLMKFDDTKSGNIDFAGFLAMAAHLGHCKSLFQWNDRANQGVISLNFHQFASLGTSFLPS
jgi:Ca2+-binding EF-hand superfamily protein